MQEWAGSNAPGMRGVFDFPDGEPSELFINPFACAIDPFLWRELQVLHNKIKPILERQQVLAVHCM
jgi:hypothetical protein